MASVSITKSEVEELQKTFKEQELKISSLQREITRRDLRIQDLLDQIGDRAKVVISRKWDSPEIKIQYNVNGVFIDMTAQDFVKSMIAQMHLERPMGWRKLVNINYPKKEQLENILLPIADKIEDEMKQSTIHFPPQ
jgi:hypothetical protein